MAEFETFTGTGLGLKSTGKWNPRIRYSRVLYPRVRYLGVQYPWVPRGSVSQVPRGSVPWVPRGSVRRGTWLYSVPEDRSPSWTTLTWLHSSSSGVSRFQRLNGKLSFRAPSNLPPAYFSCHLNCALILMLWYYVCYWRFMWKCHLYYLVCSVNKSSCCK